MKIIAISDLHMNFPTKLPKADLLIISGDATNGRLEDYYKFNQWLKYIDNIPEKIYVPGNHDIAIYHNSSKIVKILENCYTLIDSAVVINGIYIYGTPWTPIFNNWVYMKKDGELKAVWDEIPKGIDILVTHGPPRLILDKNAKGENCGSMSLYMKIFEVKPKYHIFGHIHESHGQINKEGINFINASLLNDKYQKVFKPISIKL